MPKNRRHDDSDADDDSSVILVQSPRPAKRRRHTGPVPAPRRAPQRSLLEVLKSGVFAYLDPTDLLALSYTCKRVRRFLTAEESARIWQRARKRLAGPTPPPCPASMSELAWTSLLFTMKCQQCWHATTRDVEFALRMRYCSNCQSKHVKSSQKLKKYPNVSEDVFRLVPYSWTAGKGTKTQYWWEPEVERVYREIKALDARVDSGDREAVKERKAFVTKRIRYVEEVLNNVKRCVQWQTEFKAAQETAAAERSAELRRRIVDKFHERGYRRADVEALLVDEDIRESSCSGRSWTSLFERISTELDRQYSGANAGPLRSKVEALHEHYRKYLKKYVPQEWEALIPFGDVVNMRPVLKRLRTTRHEGLAALATELPTLIDKWRNRVEKKLVALLPEPARAGDEDEEASDAATRLNLATSVFVRDRDPAPHTYPHTLLVPHLLNLEYGPLKYSTPNGPWSLDDMKHDLPGVNVVREFCRYARLDVKTATAQQLYESSLRLHCKLCRDEWPLVLNWRQAIAHLHAKHEGQRGSWGECADSVRRQVAKLEASMDIWTCLICPAGKRKKRTREDVQRHVKERHDEYAPTKGEDYSRALNVPLQDPVTVLEMHVKKVNQAMHSCRHCAHEAALPRMLEHLKSRHSITLTPSAIPPEPRASTSQASRSMQAAAAVIAIDSSSDEDERAPTKKPALFGGHSSEDDADTVSEGEGRRFRSRSQSEWNFEPFTALRRAPKSEPATDRPALGETELPDLLNSRDQDAIDDSNADPAVHDAMDVDAEDVNAIRPSIAKKDTKSLPTSDAESDDEIDEDVIMALSHTLPARKVQDGSATSSTPKGALNNVRFVDFDRRAEASTSIQAAAGRVAKTYVCTQCERTVDRLRPFNLEAILKHVITRHHVVDPSFQVHYAAADHAVFPAVMPWLTTRVYACKLCPELQRPFKWSDLDYHLAVKHKIVEPEAETHYGYYEMRDPPPADNDSPNTTTGKHQAWKGFLCGNCSKSQRLFPVTGIVEHLARQHGIFKGVFGRDFRISPKHENDLYSLRVRNVANLSLCKECGGSSSNVYRLDGLDMHMRDAHGIVLPKRAPPNPTNDEDAISVGDDTEDDSQEGDGDERRSTSSSSGEDEEDPHAIVQHHHRPRRLGGRAGRRFYCKLCTNNFAEDWLWPDLRDHLQTKHEVVVLRYGLHFMQVRRKG